MTNKVFRVLSIDGGGMRGIYTSHYLSKLQNNQSLSNGSNELFDVGAAFDLIVGASSGAIIACALAKGVSTEKITDCFYKYGQSVFPRKIPNNIFPLIFDFFLRKKSIKKGESALKQELDNIFLNTTMKDIWDERQIALSIPAIHMANSQAWIFKTPHLKNSDHRDDQYLLSDVCLASTATPLHRSLANIKPTKTPQAKAHKTFADGGLFANNPVMVALWDALEMNIKRYPIEIYCLGTIPPIKGEYVPCNKNHWGYFDWAFGNKAVDIAIDAQNIISDQMAKIISNHLMVDCQIIRFHSTMLPFSTHIYPKLDATSEREKNTLMIQAEKDVESLNCLMNDTTNSDAQKIKSLFLSMRTFHNFKTTK